MFTAHLGEMTWNSDFFLHSKHPAADVNSQTKSSHFNNVSWKLKISNTTPKFDISRGWKTIFLLKWSLFMWHVNFFWGTFSTRSNHVIILVVIVIFIMTCCYTLFIYPCYIFSQSYTKQLGACTGLDLLWRCLGSKLQTSSLSGHISWRERSYPCGIWIKTSPEKQPNPSHLHC